MKMIIQDEKEEDHLQVLNKVSENDDARKEYVDLLDVLGSESEEANFYRRKLSSKLF